MILNENKKVSNGSQDLTHLSDLNILTTFTIDNGKSYLNLYRYSDKSIYFVLENDKLLAIFIDIPLYIQLLKENNTSIPENIKIGLTPESESNHPARGYNKVDALGNGTINYHMPEYSNLQASVWLRYTNNKLVSIFYGKWSTLYKELEKIIDPYRL